MQQIEVITYDLLQNIPLYLKIYLVFKKRKYTVLEYVNIHYLFYKNVNVHLNKMWQLHG